MIPGRTVGTALAASLAVALIACSPTQPRSTPTPDPRSTIGPGSLATVEPPTSFGPPPSPTPDDSTPLVVDSTLLAIFPESVEGIAVTESIDEAALALNDPTLGRVATAVDAAVAVDAGNGNLVYAWIVRLRPDAFTDEAYRQWRDSYDDGACAAAGGVVGRAEAQIGGRQTFVTSCVAGLHTYHVWLKDQDILISASALGEGRFGEKLLEGLRVPA